MALTEDSDFIPARSTSITLTSGLVIGVRPIVPADREGIAEALPFVSDQSLFRRFFRVVTSLSDRELDYHRRRLPRPFRLGRLHRRSTGGVGGCPVHPYTR